MSRFPSFSGESEILEKNRWRMSHFVTFGSSGYYSSGCSLHTLQFPEKFGGIRIMLISKVSPTAAKIMIIFFRAIFTRGLKWSEANATPRIFLAKWLLENENVTNPYDPRLHTWFTMRKNRFHVKTGPIIASNTSFPRKIAREWLKGMRHVLLLNILLSG